MEVEEVVVVEVLEMDELLMVIMMEAMEHLLMRWEYLLWIWLVVD